MVAPTLRHRTPPKRGAGVGSVQVADGRGDATIGIHRGRWIPAQFVMPVDAFDAQSVSDDVAVVVSVGDPAPMPMRDPELGQFVTEVRRRLRDSEYQPRGEQDPIAHWIESDCWRSPATPSTNFAKAPGNRKPTQLRTYNSNLSDERHWRSAAWFSLKDRRGCGDVVLHHRALHPVIVRDRSPQMQEFRGAIWNSQRTETRFKAHNSPHKGWMKCPRV